VAKLVKQLNSLSEITSQASDAKITGRMRTVSREWDYVIERKVFSGRPRSAEITDSAISFDNREPVDFFDGSPDLPRSTSLLALCMDFRMALAVVLTSKVYRFAVSVDVAARRLSLAGQYPLSLFDRQSLPVIRAARALSAVRRSIRVPTFTVNDRKLQKLLRLATEATSLRSYRLRLKDHAATVSSLITETARIAELNASVANEQEVVDRLRFTTERAVPHLLSELVEEVRSTKRRSARLNKGGAHYLSILLGRFSFGV
jgi:hypothetical protein